MSFLFGFLLGGIVGIAIMCVIYLGKGDDK